MLESWNAVLKSPCSSSGPYKYEREVVSHLNAGGALGTFFINGNNCEIESLANIALHRMA